MLNPITLIRVWAKLQKPINQIKEISSMPLSWSRFWQILMCVLQILNLIQPLTSGKVQVGIATAIGVIQVVLHNLAGNLNPDGTPATTAYVEPPK